MSNRHCDHLTVLIVRILRAFHFDSIGRRSNDDFRLDLEGQGVAWILLLVIEESTTIAIVSVGDNY